MPSSSPTLSPFSYFVDHDPSPPVRLPSFRSFLEGQSAREPSALTTSAMQGDFIDLTEDTLLSDASNFSRQHSSQHQHQRKRRRVHDYADRRESTSRPRFNNAPLATPTEIDLTMSEDPDPFADIDLTEIEEEMGLRLEREEQRERHQEMMKQQDQLLKDSVASQEPSRQGPVQIPKICCVICLETMTNMTATHCGHLFCHSCLIAALAACENQGSEPGKGLPRCPVCRKKVMRNKKPGGKDLQQVIPLELKLMTRGHKGKGKEKEIIEPVV